jgi:hypothetical protein
MKKKIGITAAVILGILAVCYRIRGVFPEPLLLWYYDRWH